MIFGLKGGENSAIIRLPIGGQAKQMSAAERHPGFFDEHTLHCPWDVPLLLADGHS